MVRFDSNKAHMTIRAVQKSHPGVLLYVLLEMMMDVVRILVN